MSRILGIIAGSGDFAGFICRKARAQGIFLVGAAVEGQAPEDLAGFCDTLENFSLRQAPRMVDYLKRNRVREVVFAGKIDPGLVFGTGLPGGLLTRLLGSGFERSPSRLIEAAVRWLDGRGIEVIDPTPWLASAFCPEGRLTKTRIDRRVERDIAFGWEKARALADLDIGQTLIVKYGAVAAVEGIEGTDSAIRRAGQLAGPGTVVVKRRRTRQDPRVDLPAVGLDTVQSLVHAGAAALCFEAGSMPFFRREEAVALADRHRVALIARV